MHAFITSLQDWFNFLVSGISFDLLEYQNLYCQTKVVRWNRNFGKIQNVSDSYHPKHQLVP